MRPQPCAPNQKIVTPYPYYSKVRFEAVQVADGAGFNWIIQAGAVARAFAYRAGGLKVIAGFNAFEPAATIADTNLTRDSQTTSGENVQIHGIAIQALPASIVQEAAAPAVPVVRPFNPRLFAALCDAASVELSLNGDEDRRRLGNILMLPGGGGAVGGGEDVSGQMAFAPGKNLAYATNGWAVGTNYFPIGRKIIWRKGDNRDSQLNIIFTVQRDIVLESGGSPENLIGDQAAVPNVSQGWAFPNRVAVSLMVHLKGEVISERSVNV